MPSDKKPAKRKLQISEEERQRRSERMQKLRREGKVGPQFGKLGGRPRKKRASEVIAEEAEKEAQKILAVFKDAIDPSQAITVRLKGAEQWLNIEQGERRLEMDEEEHLAKMDRDELAEFVAGKITDNPMVREMFLQMLNGNGHDADAEAEDITDAEVVPEGELERGDSAAKA